MSEAGTAPHRTLDDGDDVEVQGSTSRYTLSRDGDVYMCTCPAWKNQGAPIDRRTCKHLRAYLGDEHEASRVGTLIASRAAGTRTSSGGSGSANRKDTAPPILLAHKWESDHDPTGWWMSEKLDGIRAYWDGEAFVSRLGNRFFAPDWFVEDLPADTLDGELWVGRKMFQRTTSIVRSGAASQDWRSVSYVVFDAPNAKGGFEDRCAHGRRVLARASAPHARFLEHVKCDGLEHLREELRRVETLGGEGLMLRQPGSRYAIGRSTSLLKVKTFFDTEARVIGHAPGTGRHKGRLGALICELASGARFNVGTGFSDDEREQPARIGSIVTVRYQELTDDGIPRFPSFVGERIDAELPTHGVPREVSATGATASPDPVPSPAKAEVRAVKPAKAEVRAVKPAKAEQPAKAVKPAKPEPPAKVSPPPAVAADDTPDDDDGPARMRRGPADYHVRLEHPDEGKFWEIEVRGTQHVTRFGKLGTAGQMRLTEIGSATAARTDAEKRAMQKRRGGYVNVKRG